MIFWWNDRNNSLAKLDVERELMAATVHQADQIDPEMQRLKWDANLRRRLSNANREAVGLEIELLSSKDMVLMWRHRICDCKDELQEMLEELQSKHGGIQAEYKHQYMKNYPALQLRIRILKNRMTGK